jgi:predicted RNase H-like HicB family nuclease
MQIPVLIEPVAGNGFRARGSEPFPLTVQGATAEEALQKLRELIQSRLVGGTQVVPLEIPVGEHPLAPFAGMFKDDPLFEEWQKAIAEYRQQADEDPQGT